MTTAWTATAGLAVATDAINATNFIATDAIGANLAVRNVATVAEMQNNLAIGKLASRTVVGGRITQQYALIQQTTFAAQNDVIEVLAYLLAVTAASRCASKYQTAEMIARVEEIATLTLDEIFGLRPMPLHRPDSDQLAELIRAASAARSSAGLTAMPSLH